MAADVPHDSIREAQDRSWTLRLTEIVADHAASSVELAEAFGSLEVLADHRSVGPLTAVLEDRDLDTDVRKAAAHVLNEICDTTTASQRGRWWDDGDDVLRAHALGQMGRFEAEIVVAVASDPHHPLQADALEAMAFDFCEAQFVTVLIEALAHDDPRVRFAAADALMWDEPVRAELPLLRAAQDDDPQVAEAALFALSYYPTRHVLRGVAELDTVADDDVVSQAEDTLDDLRAAFSGFADLHDREERSLARAWMEPVSDLVDWTDEDELEEERPAWTPRPKLVLPVAAHEIQAMLADPDGPWAERATLLGQVDWASHSSGERDALRAEFADHPDPDIREVAAVAYGVWGDRDALVLLLLDESATVRQLATYHLGQLDPDLALAPVLWARMLGSSGLPAEEALRSYVHHADAAELRGRLVALAKEDTREGVRTAAIGCLVDAEASEEIEQLLPLLADPPGVTWDLHVLLLAAVRTLELPVPDLEHLEVVDHLEVHEQIVRLRSRVA